MVTWVAKEWLGWRGLEGPEYLRWLGELPERSYTILMGSIRQYGRATYTGVGRSHTAWILTIEEDLSRSTTGVKSIITSGLRATEALFRQQFLRRSLE